MKNVDVVAINSACIDIVLKVDHLPGTDQKVLGEHIGDIPGGTMANFACAISNFGVSTGWTGPIGDDKEGRLALDDFSKFQVDTSRVMIEKGKRTNFTVVMIDPSGEKSIIVANTIENPTDLTDEQKEYIEKAKVIYPAPYNLEFFKKVAEFAKKHHTLVCIDVEESSPVNEDNINEVLSLTDIVIFNRYGFLKVFGERALDEERLKAVTQQALDQGLSLMAVSLGADGCLLVNQEGLIKIPAFKVEAVDTTGAGDCFNAALVYGYLNGWDSSKIGLFANAAAALSITAYGARGHLPSVEQVKNFCKINSVMEE